MEHPVSGFNAYSAQNASACTSRFHKATWPAQQGVLSCRTRACQRRGVTGQPSLAAALTSSFAHLSHAPVGDHHVNSIRRMQVQLAYSATMTHAAWLSRSSCTCSSKPSIHLCPLHHCLSQEAAPFTKSSGSRITQPRAPCLEHPPTIPERPGHPEPP